MDKNLPDKTFQTKSPWTKPSRQKPPRTIARDFVHGVFLQVFLHLNMVGPSCVTYFRGSRDV